MMKNKGLLLSSITLTIAALQLSSCVKKEDAMYNENVVANNFENIVNWGGDASSVKKLNAHSGKYAAFADTTRPYTITYQTKIGEMSAKPVKKLKISAYAMRQSINAAGALVVEIKAGDKVVHYATAEVAPIAKKPNEWVKLELVVDGATVADVFKPENEMKIYGWIGNSKDVLFFDDLKVEIEN